MSLHSQYLQTLPFLSFVSSIGTPTFAVSRYVLNAPVVMSMRPMALVAIAVNHRYLPPVKARTTAGPSSVRGTGYSVNCLVVGSNFAIFWPRNSQIHTSPLGTTYTPTGDERGVGTS